MCIRDSSIGEGYRSIQHGEADVMFAGGTESSISPIDVYKRQEQEKPERASQ